MLSGRFATPDVTACEVPARVGWLGGLPPVLVTAGSAEPFHDGAIAFASHQWRDGGDCGLLVLPRGIPCLADVAPTASITADQQHVVKTWITHQLNPGTFADAQEAINTLKPDENNFPPLARGPSNGPP